MDQFSGKNYHKTSVSLRTNSYRRLTAALRILARNRVVLSEQDLMRRLLRMFLTSWRGRKSKSKTARRYNLTTCDYVRRPAYFSHALYAALWQRGTHSGASISRMLDSAIRHYLPRLMETLLAQMPFSPFETKNSPYWRERHCRRYAGKRSILSGFITYGCNTEANVGPSLKWHQETHFIATNYNPIPVNSKESPYFYLGLSR